MLHDLIKLAHENPETRRHLLPLIRKHGSACIRVTGAQRDQYRDAVWDMFVKSYSKIGLILSRPSQMDKYAVWEVCLAGGTPVAFNLFKRTSFGLKSGLAGSDGSSAGKRYIVDAIRTKYHKPGQYGEASHKVEAIAIAAGAPAVCVTDVPKVLGKPVAPGEDGVHYSRSIQGVGAVTKILLGRPDGVSVTNPKAPACTFASANLPELPMEEIDEVYDAIVHQACMMLD